MVISHKYKYLFVELPRTGTTTINNELCKNYSGENIYNKHTFYKKFLQSASDEESKYFVFSCIRNPLDRTISLFFHLDVTLDLIRTQIKRNKNPLRYIVLIYRYLYFKRRYDYSKKTNGSFSKYFLKFYKWPYIDWSILEHNKFDEILRFENLNQDFQNLLHKLDIESVGDLPQLNKTKRRENSDYLKYFDHKAIIRAQKVYKIFLEKWGYSLPEEWGDYKVTIIDKLQFSIKLRWMKFMWLFKR